MTLSGICRNILEHLGRRIISERVVRQSASSFFVFLANRGAVPGTLRGPVVGGKLFLVLPIAADFAKILIHAAILTLVATARLDFGSQSAPC